jgi:glycine C-acetyltransferase
MILMFIFNFCKINGYLAAETLSTIKSTLRSQMFAKSLPMIQVIGSLKRLELLLTQN